MSPTDSPKTGQVVRVRQRTWLVDAVENRPYADTALVRLSCLDDDDAGQSLEVLWSHEIDAEILPEQNRLLEGVTRLDDPRMFGAYLNALRWNCVTSTDKRLLQAPFRAGIDLKVYQLEPIRKALELPRVNLFIADDVGLGKTIEAGLILQELILRQRVDRVLVIAPPAVTVQWQEELEQRFGMQFAIYDREFVTARRRERGFGVNPWTTHSRFIVSYALLRGARSRSRQSTPHLQLLLDALRNVPGRSLLILDECHQVAPSAGSAWPIDTRTTAAIRQIAGWFEHRLFLSATPHNGHSHSFASLLHLLDPQRFTRGVPVQSASELAPVMVRRLKRHLRQHVGGFPERVLVDHRIDLPPDAPEIRLGELLARYDTLYRQCLSELPKQQQAARALVIVNLHKRLLSSIEAFQHTLELHARGAERTLSQAAQQILPEAPRRDVDDDDVSEEELDERDDAFVQTASVDPGEEARRLLTEMRELARRHRREPDARVQALAAWIRDNLCPQGRWNERRVVIFTEYDHTLQWLRRVLPEVLGADCTRRIEAYTGRLGEAQREALKAAFNSPPHTHPLRILLATDAAREGINLQAHCADLFHFDLPWNPSRIEQRNGRIDRVLQPSPQVRCHYFYLPDRPEDRVLAYVVRKLGVIREELGSLSEVVSARLATRFEEGIRDVTPEEVDQLTSPDDSALRAQAELEGEGAELLRGDLDRLRNQLERSERRLGYRPEQLCEVVDLGLQLVCGKGLEPIEGGEVPSWRLPELDSTWEPVLGAMRERPPEDAPRWYRPPVRPVAFRAAHRLDADTVQLHLGHPLVQRLLGRFRAQGFAAHDLSRVTLVENTRDATRRVIAFGRLALFGNGASRLHEEIIAVAARCTETGIEPFGEAGEHTTLELLDTILADRPAPHPDTILHGVVRRRAEQDFHSLWKLLADRATEADSRAVEALGLRGRQESEAMQAVLERQRKRIQKQLEKNNQLALGFSPTDTEARQAFERDQRFMKDRLEEIDAEQASEPARIAASYEVVLRRFEPVGLAYLWPTS